MSSSLFHIARPHLQTTAERTCRIRLNMALVAAEMALALAVAAETEMMIAMKMIAMTMRTSTGMEYLGDTPKINGDINGEESGGLSGHATAAASSPTLPKESVRIVDVS